ncbi:MAG: hypothetical protein LBK66_10360 [Spirochaetaceae bacterium]|nr:hypothetical protein [Spirochaetaceae bacterium]
MQKLLFLFVCAVLLSCEDDTDINTIMGVASEAPVFIAYRAESGTEVKFQFSTPVKIIQAFLDTGDDIEPFTDEYDRSISLRFTSDHSGGKAFTADLLVEDADGNSLNVLVPFKTRNDRMPKLVINEIRLNNTSGEYAEFIELRTQTDGNLGAMRLFVASTSIDEPIYEFPLAEVAAGEYITLHLRTLDVDKAVDELGDKLDLASAGKDGKDSNNEARDLWTPVSTKYLHENADVIYLLDQDDMILDGLAITNIAKNPDAWDKNKNFSKTAELLAKQGAWLDANGKAVKTPGVTDTVNTENNTRTRTLCRNEAIPDSNTLADWYICANSSASPGAKNSTTIYAPKSTKSVAKKL